MGTRLGELLRLTAEDLVDLTGVFRTVMSELNQTRSETHLERLRPVLEELAAEIELTVLFNEEIATGAGLDLLDDPRVAAPVFREIGTSLMLIAQAPDVAALEQTPLLDAARLDEMLGREPLLSWLLRHSVNRS